MVAQSSIGSLTRPRSILGSLLSTRIQKATTSASRAEDKAASATPDQGETTTPTAGR